MVLAMPHESVPLNVTFFISVEVATVVVNVHSWVVLNAMNIGAGYVAVICPFEAIVRFEVPLV